MRPDDLEQAVSSVVPPRLSPSGLRRSATVLYVLLGGIAIGWIRLRTGSWWPSSLPGRKLWLSLALGASTAGLTVALSAWLLRRSRATAWLARQIRDLIGSPDRRTTLQIALLSGFGEELFFRAAMQPALGYALTSVLFGLLHTGPDRRFLAWTAFALVLGFILGGILEATDSLAGPIFAHIAINYLNLRRLARLEFEEEPPDLIGTPRAAGDASHSFQNAPEFPKTGGGGA